MHLFLVRHAQPVASVGDGAGADPALSDLGLEMAARIPSAMSRFGITRIISSPQQRAQQTAKPLSDALGLPVETDVRFAEYDYGLPDYVPVEQLLAKDPTALARLLDGHLPDGVDADAFTSRVIEAKNELVAGAARGERVALFSHGGVMNVILGEALRTPILFPFRADYVSVSHVHYSSAGKASVQGVNNIEHVWDLLPGPALK